jgi:hypothetical protein
MTPSRSSTAERAGERHKCLGDGGQLFAPVVAAPRVDAHLTHSKETEPVVLDLVVPLRPGGHGQRASWRLYPLDRCGAATLRQIGPAHI